MIRDVLQLARYPVMVANIIQEANLDSAMASRVIIHLRSKGYLERCGKTPKRRGIFYQRTKDGIALQIKINEIEEMLR